MPIPPPHTTNPLCVTMAMLVASKLHQARLAQFVCHMTDSNVTGLCPHRLPYDQQLAQKQQKVVDLLVAARSGLKEWANELPWLEGYEAADASSLIH